MTPLTKFKKDFAGKKVLVMGLGLLGQGLGVAQFLLETGAKIRVTDLKTKEQLKKSLDKLCKYPIIYRLGEHKREDFVWADVVIKNPAVRPDSPYLKIAKQLKKPVFMDTSLFCLYQNCHVVGITGTRGKSTVSMLAYYLLKEAGYDVFYGGNLPGRATLPLIAKIKPSSWVVLELSSWQLAGLKEIHYSPPIAIITNIYPDHLNYYHSMDEYVSDKKVIFRWQSKDDFLLLNSRQDIFKSYPQEAKSKIVWFKERQDQSLNSRLLGDHNQSNLGAIYELAKILHINEHTYRKTVKTYPGLPFRLEKTVVVKGVQFINDSASTTPIATIKAVTAMTKPFWLILGGNSKNLPDDEMIKIVVQKARGILLLAGDYSVILTKKIIQAGGKDRIVGQFNKLDLLVKAGLKAASPGEVVLFSPGYTSFGLFTNEFDRGHKFNQAVNKLLSR